MLPAVLQTGQDGEVGALRVSLMTLRQCFPPGDSHQGALDNLEQGLNSLLTRLPAYSHHTDKAGNHSSQNSSTSSTHSGHSVCAPCDEFVCLFV